MRGEILRGYIVECSGDIITEADLKKSEMLCIYFNNLTWLKKKDLTEKSYIIGNRSINRSNSSLLELHSNTYLIISRSYSVNF